MCPFKGKGVQIAIVLKFINPVTHGPLCPPLTHGPWADLPIKIGLICPRAVS
jgi:hypothetical protein